MSIPWTLTVDKIILTVFCITCSSSRYCIVPDQSYTAEEYFRRFKHPPTPHTHTYIRMLYIHTHTFLTTGSFHKVNNFIKCFFMCHRPMFYNTRVNSTNTLIRKLPVPDTLIITVQDLFMKENNLSHFCDLNISRLSVFMIWMFHGCPYSL
jgi:hypothetical protein